MSKALIKTPKIKTLTEHPNIPGLYYIDDIITKEEELELIDKIYDETWLTELTRRVQHHGYKYNYRKRKIDKSNYLGPLPNWSNNVEKKIYNTISTSNLNLPYQQFDQLIVNEYKTGQGIGAHIDCVPCFHNGIFSLTICNAGVMTFKHDNVIIDVLLKRRSLVILTGESRYVWTHEIDKKKNTFTDDIPRVSLTYRKVTLE